MKILDHILPLHDLYVEGFALLLGIIGFFEPLCFVILAIYLYWQRKAIKWQLLIILCVLLGGRYVLFQINQSLDEIHDTVKVVDIDHYETSQRLTIRYLSHRYHIYVYQDDFRIGDWIDVCGEVKTYESASIPDGFNQRTYYLSQNVVGQIDVTTVSFVRSGFSIFQIRETWMSQVQSDHQSFVKSFVFGKDQLADAISKPLRQAGLLFLMQTTGLHAYVIVMMIKKGMFYFDIDEQTQDKVTLSIYAILCYLNGFALGVVRLLFTQIFHLLNKRFKWRLTPLDRLLIVCFIMVMFHVQWVYSVGFLMTILILLTIELARDRYQVYQGYLKQLVIALLIQIVCIPFTGQFNVLVTICLPIVIVYVTYLIYPLTFVACFTTHIDKLMTYVFQGLTGLMNLINLKPLTWYLPVLNGWQILLYYALFVYLLRAFQVRQFIMRTILLTSIFGFNIVNDRFVDNASVYFLDVGQGDTTYIETKSCRVMIDSFEGANDFLKNHGVNQLDYLFLTHSDEDHTKEARDIIRDIGVDRVIINPFDDCYEIDQANVLLGYTNQQWSCGDLIFQILGPRKDYGQSNNNSLVICATICGDQYLFTGDINHIVERDLVNYYGELLDADILKVAHHGSNTSSLDSFINIVSPRYAIIFAGRDNRYQFPHQETLKTLMKYGVSIKRTDQLGTIQIHYKHTERLWETTLPISQDF